MYSILHACSWLFCSSTDTIQHRPIGRSADRLSSSKFYYCLSCWLRKWTNWHALNPKLWTYTEVNPIFQATICCINKPTEALDDCSFLNDCLKQLILNPRFCLWFLWYNLFSICLCTAILTLDHIYKKFITHELNVTSCKIITHGTNYMVLEIWS